MGGRKSIRILVCLAAAAVVSVGSVATGATSTRSRVVLASANVVPLAYGDVAAVEEGSSGGVVIYPPGLSNAATPVRSITTGTGAMNLQYPFGHVAFDARGDIWVMDNGDRIDEFAPNASGAATAMRVITGANTDLDGAFGLTIAPNGNIWVVDCQVCESPSGGPPSAVLEFASSASGDVAPIRDITGANTDLGGESSGIAVSADGRRVWVAPDGPSLLGFKPSQTGNVAPVSTITKPDAYADSVSVDGFGDLVVGQESETSPYPGVVSEYSPGGPGEQFPAGDSSPSAVGQANETGTSEGFQDDVAITPKGLVLADCFNDGIVSTFNLFAAPNEQLKSTLSGYFSGIAVYAAKPSAPRSLKAVASRSSVKLSWRSPKTSGGGLEGYAIYAKSSKRGNLKLLGLEKRRSLTISKLKRNRRYHYSVAAFNSRGFSRVASLTVRTD